MIIFLSLLVAIVGALMYGISQNAKVQELGRISFFAGLLAFLIRFGSEALGALGRN